YVGEEIRDMPEWLTLPDHKTGAVLALRHGVIPMLDAPAFAEQKIVVMGDVTSGVDAGPVGLEVLVYHYAVGELDSAPGEEAGRRLHSDAGHHDVSGDRASSHNAYGMDGVIAAKRFYRGIAFEVHSTRGVVTLEKA